MAEQPCKQHQTFSEEKHSRGILAAAIGREEQTGIGANQSAIEQGRRNRIIQNNVKDTEELKWEF